VVGSVLACPLPIPDHHTSTLHLALPPSHSTTLTWTGNKNLVDTEHYIRHHTGSSLEHYNIVPVQTCTG